MEDDIIPPTVEDLAAMGIEIPQEGRVILNIFADWCEPCKEFSPILHKLAEEGEFLLVEANLDETDPLCEKHNINAVPTLILFRDGQRAGDILIEDTEDVPLAEVLAEVLEHDFNYQVLQDKQPMDDLSPFEVRLTSTPVRDGVLVGFRDEDEMREILQHI